MDEIYEFFKLYFGHMPLRCLFLAKLSHFQDQIPFDTYFRVDAVQKYHRAITMEKFMKNLAPKIWPKGNRTGENFYPFPTQIT